MSDRLQKPQDVRCVEEYTPREFDVDEHLDELGLEKPPKGIHPLDREDVRKRFAKVSSWFAQERVRQADFRSESMADHEFYDGPGQWTQEEKNLLAQRSQVPITFNQVKPTVDWVLGTEKKIRVDYRILPRGEEDAKNAEMKTKLFKYVSDTNNAGFKRSKSFADAVLAGVGWIDHCINADPDNEPLVVGYEDWRNVWYDTLSVEDDLSDARYIFRGKWVDEDVACAMFPDRADIIHAAVISGDQGFGYDVFSNMLDPAFDPNMSGGFAHGMSGVTLQYTGFFGYIGSQVSQESRDRVFLVECQYRTPAKKKQLRGKELGTLQGITFDETNEHHLKLVEMGIGQAVEATVMEMRQMIFTGDSVLQDGESPYRHKRFSLVPIWGFKRKKNGTPYGIVRNLRDPQKDLNKRRSKALYLLSANRVVADDDAIKDTDQSWDDIVKEANRPDGLIKVYPKSQRGIEIQNETKLAMEHVALMTQDEKYIQSASGVTDELMGRDTNAVSGKAIRARQEQGGVVTTAFFDNNRLAFKLSGEIILSMIEQLYTEEKKIRITGGENGKAPEFMEINKYDPGTDEIIGDITSSQADFVISEQDYSATVREAMFDSMTEILKTLQPEAAIQVIDLWFELSDLPGKEKFVDRFRAITGQRGTDAEPTPEQQAQDKAKADAATQAAEAQNQILQVQLEAEKVKVVKLEQEAQLIAAKIKTESVNQQVSAAGVDYDKEKLRMEKASTLNTIEQGEHQRSMQTQEQGAKAQQAAHGMMMTEKNAEHTADQAEHQKGMDERRMVLDEKLVKAKDKPNGSVERGLKSNNHKK